MRDYSRQTSAGVKSIIEHINRLRYVASDVYAHEKLPPKKMKSPLLEKYIDYTVKVGMMEPEKTDLNYSQQGQIRREWLYHLDRKQKEAEDFIEESVVDEAAAAAASESRGKEN